MIHSAVIMNFQKKKKKKKKKEKKRKIEILAYVICSAVAGVRTDMICTNTLIIAWMWVAVIYVYTAILSGPSRMTVAIIATIIVVVAFPIYTNISVSDALINLYFTPVPLPSTFAAVIK